MEKAILTMVSRSLRMELAMLMLLLCASRASCQLIILFEASNLSFDHRTMVGLVVAFRHI